MKHLTKAALCTLFTATIALPAVAETPFEDQIEARQSYFQVLKHNMGLLGSMVKGKRDYDPAIADAAAKDIYLLSQLNNTLMWPAGSDLEQAETKAKPEIWQNGADVQEKFKALNTAAEQLAANAGQGADALKKSFGPVGKSCKSCHDDYRAK
ncbi:c-type cytochrome [Neptuniibacter halophilus]|uniref:c-type cytochrome n=1 Tax=Neptuniibacter halophilus TaxID=651666 RepID=UPI002573C36D|nr:cytochrome c [Neptuniibacter halophilus]